MAKRRTDLPEVTLARAKWQSSGISDEEAVRLNLAPLSPAETGALAPNFHPVASLKITYFDFDGEPTSFYRIRYLEPLPGFAGAAVKPQRYAQAPGTLNEVYLPPLLARPWREIAKDPNERIVITEGELKAAAGCLAGSAVIGLGGVDVWRSAKRGMELLPALLEIEWSGRPVVILFDSDAAHNPNVVRAQRSLARALLNRGARPSIAALPPGPGGAKQGLDDWLLATGGDALAPLLDGAGPYEEADALWSLNEEVLLVKDPGVILVKETSQRMDSGTFVHTIFANRHYVEVTVNAQGVAVRKQKPLAPRWLKWEARGEVERMTYAPGQPRLTEGREWNTWGGWGVEPRPGDVQPWHDLMSFVFKDAPEDRIWFEKWLAYPLQHPGVKLLTAAVIYGVAKGTGKTLIAYLMGDIYGANFIEIENDDLKGAFNSWAANRQFIYADEITGGDARVDADKLKRIITRETVTINTKFVPQYTLPDRANFFISSNHPDAIFLEDGDRRYFVHEIVGGPSTSPGFYQRLDAWRKAGGAAHLFDYLLGLDLTGFDPKAAAPETAAKRQMLVHSRSDLDAWVAQLREDPFHALRLLGDSVAQDCELFTPGILLRAYDPNGHRKVTATGMGKALARAGFHSINCGSTIRTKLGSQRLTAVRNVAAWKDSAPKLAAEHFDKHFGPLAGKF